MRYILDACTLIYMIKANLTHDFINICDSDIVIDKEVYTEVVDNGKSNNYPDAFTAEKFLIDNKIPIIPTDIQQFIKMFRDPGETSCFELAKIEGICITSDKRAFNKFVNQKVAVIRLDTFFYQNCLKKKYSKTATIGILENLLNVYATTPERYATFIKLITQSGE